MPIIDLLNKPYKDGVDDCYGLARQYYINEYGLVLRNYARPIGFDEADLPLLDDNFNKEGFQSLGQPALANLERGDGLLFNLFKSKHANHVGIYLGNGYFVHHLYQKVSECVRLDDRWYGRVSRVVRHSDVTNLNTAQITKLSILELLPPHLQGRFHAR